MTFYRRQELRSAQAITESGWLINDRIVKFIGVAFLAAFFMGVFG